MLVSVLTVQHRCSVYGCTKAASKTRSGAFLGALFIQYSSGEVVQQQQLFLGGCVRVEVGLVAPTGVVASAPLPRGKW